MFPIGVHSLSPHISHMSGYAHSAFTLRYLCTCNQLTIDIAILVVTFLVSVVASYLPELYLG